MIAEMKTGILTLTICSATLLTGCSYNELPPKTDDATTDYILPKGTVPTAEETAAVAALREEYRTSIENR